MGGEAILQTRLGYELEAIVHPEFGDPHPPQDGVERGLQGANRRQQNRGSRPEGQTHAGLEPEENGGPHSNERGRELDAYVGDGIQRFYHLRVLFRRLPLRRNADGKSGSAVDPKIDSNRNGDGDTYHHPKAACADRRAASSVHLQRRYGRQRLTTDLSSTKTRAGWRSRPQYVK
jgi:hypothetical protein